MTTYTTVTDSSGRVRSIPPVNDGALLRYLRHVHGDVDASKIISEARKLGLTIRVLVEMGDHEAVRELIACINNAPIQASS